MSLGKTVARQTYFHASLIEALDSDQRDLIQVAITHVREEIEIAGEFEYMEL